MVDVITEKYRHTLYFCFKKIVSILFNRKIVYCFVQPPLNVYLLYFFSVWSCVVSTSKNNIFRLIHFCYIKINFYIHKRFISQINFAWLHTHEPKLSHKSITINWKNFFPAHNVITGLIIIWSAGSRGLLI